MYLRFLFYTLAMWIMTFLGMIILAPVLLFVKREAEVLPSAFRWFDNFEAYDIPGSHRNIDGLMGPDYYREERGTSDKSQLSFFKIWWERYNFLALRNPCNYFKYRVIGLFVPTGTSVICVTENNVGTHEYERPGLDTVILMIDGKYYFEHYYVTYIGSYIYSFRLGWKLRDIHVAANTGYVNPLYGDGSGVYIGLPFNSQFVSRPVHLSQKDWLKDE